MPQTLCSIKTMKKQQRVQRVQRVQKIQKMIETDEYVELRIPESDIQYFILTPDLVPTTSWYKNLRNKDPKAWGKIRKASYAKAGHKCEICGAKGMLHCHEQWEYDNIKGIQKLVGLISLCPDCHEVMHIGLAELNGRYENAIQHMMKVNNIGKRKAEEIVRSSFIAWKKLSKIQWELDLSFLDSIKS
jgi:hypothetical protein